MTEIIKDILDTYTPLVIVIVAFSICFKVLLTLLKEERDKNRRDIEEIRRSQKDIAGNIENIERDIGFLTDQKG